MFGKHKQLPTYDEASFEVTYSSGNSQMQQIKISLKWVNPQCQYRLPTFNCQWFNKTHTSMDLIQGVSQECYQPSVLDVGSCIHLQMVPEAKEIQYIGMPITHTIGPLQLSEDTEEQVLELMEVGKSTYFVEVQSLKMNKKHQSKLNPGELPKDCLLKLVKGKMLLMGKWKGQDKSSVIKQTNLSKFYPQIELNRNKSKEAIIRFNQNEEVSIVLQNHRIRDVLYLVLKRVKQTMPEVAEAEEVKNGSEEVIKSEDSLKKAEESLPLSPQTQQMPKQSKQNEERKVDVEQSVISLQECQKQQKIKATEFLQKGLKLQKCLREKAQEQACYHKNECRLLSQQLNEEKDQNTRLQSNVEQLTKKLEVKLMLLVQKDKEIQKWHYKSQYQVQQIQMMENQTREMSEQLQTGKDQIKHLQRKIQSLGEAKSILAQQMSCQPTQSSQIGSYQFQIGQLKQQINILKEQKFRTLQQCQKDTGCLKTQIKELIQENTCLRSKEKGTKGELKNEIVQLKKLVNRFGESLTEKDMMIDNLRFTNKKISQELNYIRQHSKPVEK